MSNIDERMCNKGDNEIKFTFKDDEPEQYQQIQQQQQQDNRGGEKRETIKRMMSN